MPAYKLEYGVLYYFEDGPTREHIFDCVRLGQQRPFHIKFTFRGEGRDWIGPATAKVEGIHQKGSDDSRLLLFGRLDTKHNHKNESVAEIWQKAFFIAQCRLACRSHGRILLADRSFFDNPLKQFGNFEDMVPDL